MIRLHVDKAKNRLDLIANQQVNEADMLQLVRELSECVHSMQPGWIMVTDYRGLAMLDPNLNPYIVQVQKIVRAASPRKVAVLLDNEVLQLQLRMGADMAVSNDITRRFTDEREWLAYIDRP